MKGLLFKYKKGRGFGAGQVTVLHNSAQFVFFSLMPNQNLSRLCSKGVFGFGWYPILQHWQQSSGFRTRVMTFNKVPIQLLLGQHPVALLSFINRSCSHWRELAPSLRLLAFKHKEITFRN